MTNSTNSNNPVNIGLPKGSPVYKNSDRRVVDSVFRELVLSMECMVVDRPYDAQFLLWPLWAARPTSHHCTLGKILSDIVESGAVPLVAMSGSSVGSTRVLYFLDKPSLYIYRINHSLKKPNTNRSTTL